MKKSTNIDSESAFDNNNNYDINITEKDRKCAPGIVFDGISCMSLKVIIDAVKSYNMESTGNKIQLYDNFEMANPTKYKKYLMYKLKKNIINEEDQAALIDKSFTKHMKESNKITLEKYTFRPKSPKGKFTWLNTTNINEVMDQYERKYKDFKFLGAVPIDFDDLPLLGISTINFQKLKMQGKTKLGFIFNLDKHNQPGSHWVALFVDLNKGWAAYYDSFSSAPSEEIRKLIRRIERYLKSIGKRGTYDYNKLVHQTDSYNCGVYSIDFILKMVKGVDFNDILTRRVTKQEMDKARQEYFL